MQLTAEQVGQLVAARRRVLAALMSIHARRKQAVLGMGLALLQGSLVRSRSVLSSCAVDGFLYIQQLQGVRLSLAGPCR